MLKALTLTFSVLFSLAGLSSLRAQTTTSCFEIESILVDACGPDEGLNEMVQLISGPNPLLIGDFDIQWATASNPFLGFCQNATTAALTATINSTITGCGSVIEPPGGVIPPNSTVVIITSTQYDPLSNTFANLNEDVYVVYQCGAQIIGNFSNNAATPRTLTITYTGAGACSDDVTYLPTSLVGGDGASVAFEFDGTPSYFNNGCQGLLELLDPSWDPPTTVCSSEAAFDLADFLTGTPGGTWSGTGVTGSMFDPSGLNGSYSITYTLTPNGCATPVSESHSITVNAAGSPAWTSPGNLCSGSGNFDLSTTITGVTGGTWSGTGVTGNTFNPSGLSGSISITYTTGAGACLQNETHPINVISSSDASWTLPPALCAGDAPIDLSAQITGTTGGTWSGSGITGSMFDPAGLSGSIAVTYTVGTGSCQQQNTQNITINPAADAAWTVPTGLCTGSPIVNLNAQVTGNTGGIWSGNGVTAGNFNPAGLSGNIDVTYSVGSGNCAAQLTQTIVVNSGPDPSWDFVETTICENATPINLNALVTGVAGGTWSGTGVSGGFFNPLGLNGNYTITYSIIQNGCESTLNRLINVTNLPSASWTSPPTLCDNAVNLNLSTLITGTTGGIWSGTGVSGNTLNPQGLSGWISVTYTVGAPGCQSTESHNINVLVSPPVVEIVGATTYCENDQPPALTANTINNALWYADAGMMNLVHNGLVFTPPAQSSPATYYVVQNDGSCSSLPTSITVTPIQIPDAPITDDTVTWCEGSPVPDLNAYANNTIHWYSNAALTQLVHVGPVFESGAASGTTFWLRAESNQCVSDPVTTYLLELTRITAEILGNDTVDACLPVAYELVSADSVNNYWSNGSFDNSIWITREGKYYLNRSGVCNLAIDSVFVRDVSFNVNFTPGNTEGFAPISVPMLYDANGATSCVWFVDGIETELNEDGSILFERDTVYTVSVVCENESGCKSKSEKEVIVGFVQLLLPTSFTPNADGLNDAFKPAMYGIQELEMFIFNRWGEEIYSDKGLDAEWNGQLSSGEFAADGLYVCLVRATDKNFKLHKINSSILLMR